MKRWIVFWASGLLGLSAMAGEDGWKCEWFGMGCPQGEQNAVLMDLGRQNTNTGFLFFDGDTAVIKRTLELTFSDRAIAKGDKLILQVEAASLPAGVSVSVDGQNCLAPAQVEIRARQNSQRVTLQWVVPPTGEDVDLTGALNVTPVGFDRAGSMPLAGKKGVSLEMLRLQGEVDDDWHWAKRTTFWFWFVVLTSILLIKFFFAPVFFHPRLKVNKALVQVFPAEGPFAQGMGSPIQSKKWRGKREVWLVGSRKKSREKRSAWRDFLYGKTLVEVRDYLGGAEFRVRRGARSRRGGVRVEVMLWQGGKPSPHSVYSTNDPEFNRIPYQGENQDRVIQFEIE